MANDRLSDHRGDLWTPRGPVDIPFLLLTLLLLGIGVVMVLSASYASAYYDVKKITGGNATYFFTRQLAFAVAGVGAMYIVSRLPMRFFRRISGLTMLIALVLLLAVLVVGHVSGGGRRWLYLGGVSIQPSEIAKIAVILYFATLICRSGNYMGTFRYGILPFVLILAVIVGLLVMNDVSSEYAKLFDYMVRNGLCDLQPSAAKLDVSFTTDLPQYHSAYIFSSPGGTLEDVSTLIHEFGHFAQACLDEGGVRCYDVAEIDSQGLEALYLKYADSIAGEAGGDAFRCDTASRLLRLVIQGCLFDEFQQKVYENGNMSVTEMNRLYRSLGEEYGMNFVSTGDEAYGWVDVNHNYEQPFYYLSYATSAAASLELLTLSMDDPNGADNKYLQLVADSDDDSYCALMRRSGLPSVFEEKNVQALADRTLRYMEREVADVPDYTDISGHWFESGAKLISAEGLMWAYSSARTRAASR